VRVIEAIARDLCDRGIRHCFGAGTIRRQARKNAARLQKMTRNRLRTQQVTLFIRSTLHTTIITNNQPQPVDRRGIIQGTPSVQRQEFGEDMRRVVRGCRRRFWSR
jgi:hypothetical protein